MADAIVKNKGDCFTDNIDVSSLVPQSSDPPAVADVAQIYAKLDGSVVDIWVMDSSGAKTKLTTT